MQIVSNVLYLLILIVFLYWTFNAYSRYMDEPKATEIIYQRGEDSNNPYYIKYPIITVCENAIENNEHSLMKDSNVCNSRLVTPFLSYIRTCLEKRKDISVESLLENITVKYEDIINNVVIIDGGQQKLLETNWTTVYHQTHGLCFSLDISKTNFSDIAKQASTLTK